MMVTSRPSTYLRHPEDKRKDKATPQSRDAAVIGNPAMRYTTSFQACVLLRKMTYRNDISALFNSAPAHVELSVYLKATS